MPRRTTVVDHLDRKELERVMDFSLRLGLVDECNTFTPTLSKRCQ